MPTVQPMPTYIWKSQEDEDLYRQQFEDFWKPIKGRQLPSSPKGIMPWPATPSVPHVGSRRITQGQQLPTSGSTVDVKPHVVAATATREIPWNTAMTSDMAMQFYRNQVQITLGGQGEYSGAQVKKLIALPVSWIASMAPQGLWCCGNIENLDRPSPGRMLVRVTFAFELVDDMQGFVNNHVLMNKLSHEE